MQLRLHQKFPARTNEDRQHEPRTAGRSHGDSQQFDRQVKGVGYLQHPPYGEPWQHKGPTFWFR